MHQSLLVLPHPDAAARAIKLAAWAMVLSQLAVWLEPLGAVTGIMFVAAVHLLRSRSGLAYTPRLGLRLQRLFVISLVVLIAWTVGFAGKWAGIRRGQWITSVLSASSPRAPSQVFARATPGGSSYRTVIGMTGYLQIATDRRGNSTVTVLGDEGNVISRHLLRSGTSVTAADEKDRAVTVAMDAAGSVTVSVAPAARGVRPVRLAALIASAALDLIQFPLTVVATILFLLVCADLALRSKDKRLAQHFRIILRLFVAGVVAVGLGVAVSALVVAARAPNPIVGSITAVLLLAGIGALAASGVWQIVACFKLAAKLRSARRVAINLTPLRRP